MPWDASSFQKHNHGLNKAEAGKAATQANAVLKSSGDEGLSIAVANKHAKESPSSRLYGRKVVR